MSAALDTLYDTDFVAWAEREAAALRRLAAERPNLPLDWENVAEEIEGLARSDRREVRSRFERIVEHMLKLRLIDDPGPRAGWRRTIAEQRRRVLVVIGESPSLRPRLPGLLEDAKRLAGLAFEGRLATKLAAIAAPDAADRLPATLAAISLDDVLDDGADNR